MTAALPKFLFQIFLHPLECNWLSNVSIEQRRGIETIDVNDVVILVKAPIEEVAQAFSSLRNAELWQRDVYRREIEIIGYGFVIFQFRGQVWTLIKGLNAPPNWSNLIPGDAQSLSSLLHARAIYYKISDTAGTFEYIVYDDGTLMEMLRHEEGISTEFQSQVRSFKPEENRNAYSFFFKFVVEQDAYIPDFFATAYYEVGQQILIEKELEPLEDLEPENFERIDYVALR